MSKKGHEKRAWCRFFGATCFLCFAVSLLAIPLLLSILLIGMGVPLRIPPVTVGDALAAIYQSAVFPIAAFIAELIKLYFPWPAFLTGLLVVALLWPERVIRILSIVGEFEFLGFKFKGKSSSAPTATLRKELGDAERLAKQTNKEIEEAYKAAGEYVADLRERHDLASLTSQFSKDVAGMIGENCPDDFRLTLYIPDLLFPDRLLQFTEYYNKRGERSSYGKAGRTLSIRYGIVGRVWRSKVNEVEGNLLSGEDWNQLYSQDPSGKKLINQFIARRWGLTLDEVPHIKEYNSYGGVLVQRDGKALGVVFFDSKEQEAFGRDGVLISDLVGKLRASKLCDQLFAVSIEVEPWAGAIDIFRTPR